MKTLLFVLMKLRNAIALPRISFSTGAVDSRNKKQMTFGGEREHASS